MAFKNYRQQSRDIQWGTENEGGLSSDQINMGSLLRMADAMELMSQNYAELVKERDRYKQWYKDEQDEAEYLRRSNSAFRGVITKLKKQLGEN